MPDSIETLPAPPLPSTGSAASRRLDRPARAPCRSGDARAGASRDQRWFIEQLTHVVRRAKARLRYRGIADTFDFTGMILESIWKNENCRRLFLENPSALIRIARRSATNRVISQIAYESAGVRPAYDGGVPLDEDLHCGPGASRAVEQLESGAFLRVVDAAVQEFLSARASYLGDEAKRRVAAQALALHLAGHSNREIASLLGVPRETVRLRLDGLITYLSVRLS